MPWSSPSTRSRPPASRSHAPGRIEPEQRDRLQRLARRERRCVAERRARPRVEQVDRHLARFELGELEREVDALLERLAHAEDAAAAQLHAGVASRGARSRRGRRRCASCRSSGTARGTPRGCGCSGARPRRRAAAACSSVEQPERARDFEPGLALHRVDRVDDLRAAGAPRARAPRRRCRTGSRPRRASRARRRGPRRGRGTAYTSTPVWKRTDCEQNAQSSGHAPDLALMRLSSSTSGPHHASRTLCASAMSDGQLVERELRRPRAPRRG